MIPKVSICVPNLNTRPFLPERFQTILEQSLEDWELLVYDSYSTDGAWEYIQELAAGEPRMRVWQGPREGTPGSWNPCIQQARGQYVYIATSDDTMPPDALQKLVAALDANPDCDIAHCPLNPIDQDGRKVADTYEWWSESSSFALSSGPLLHVTHVRRAPFDGLLHLLGGSVYVSITQLLIRRTLFDRIGYFESQWGSVGDFNWTMRAGLIANTIHVPDTWGGWRVHPTQATAATTIGSPDHTRKIDAMIDHALTSCAAAIAPAVQCQVRQWSDEARRFRKHEFAFESRRTTRQRAGYLLSRTLSGSREAREHFQLRLRGRPTTDWVSNRLRRVGVETALVRRVASPQFAAAPGPSIRV